RNDNEVIDPGVMGPPATILSVAEKHQVDINGVSGLITPSLDEMTNVAADMPERGNKSPLIIGGAATARIYTSERIAPQFSHTEIHVNDASRSVTVAGSLHGKDKEAFCQGVKEEYEKLRTDHKNRNKEKRYISIDEARKNKFPIDWGTQKVVKPTFLGTKKF